DSGAATTSGGRDMERREASARIKSDTRRTASIGARHSKPELSLPYGFPALRSGGRIRRLIRRSLPLGIAAALVLVAFWTDYQGSTSESRVATTAPWEFELAADGLGPGLALALSREAGLHIVHVPAAGDPNAEPTRLPVRLLEADLYLVSLGWSPLEMRTRAPSGADPMAFGATGRFIKAYHTAERTGVRTSWR